MANNRIQIKRSATTATPTSLLPGELAFSNVTGGSGVLFIGDTSNSVVVAIGGVRNPGTLTANQALVANATSGIDKVIVANLVPTALWANGSGGTAGDVLTSNSTGVYWKAPSAGVAGSDTQVQFNDGGNLAGDSAFTFNKTTDALTVNGVFQTTNTGAGTGGFSANTTRIIIGNNTINTAVTSAGLIVNGTATIANSTGVYTGVVNGSTIQVGSSIVANSTRLVIGTAVGLQANGGIGTSGQQLYSNGTTVYWADPAGDITGVTAGNGLTGGGTSGAVTLDVGAGNGITVAADSVSVDGANGISVDASGVNVLAGNNQLISNTSGLWIDQTKIDHNSLSNYDANRHIDHTAVTITAGNGLTGGGTIAASRTIDVAAGNGISVSADAVAAVGANGISVTTSGINVLAGNSGVISNASGVFVNAATFSIATSQLSGDVALGTQTSGSYVATITAGSGLTGDGTGEGSTPTVAVGAGNGISVSADAVAVNGGSTLTVNSAGVHVNNTLSIQDLTLSGNLTINGTLTTIDTTNLVVNDSIISLARNNGADSLDIGLYGQYNDGTERFTGLIWDTSTDIYELFANTTVEPTTTLDIGATGYTTARLKAFLTSGGLTTNSTSANLVANSTYTVGVIANSIFLSGRSNNDLLFANSTGGITGLAFSTTGGYVVQSNGTAIVYDYLDGGTF